LNEDVTDNSSSPQPFVRGFNTSQSRAANTPLQYLAVYWAHNLVYVNFITSGSTIKHQSKSGPIAKVIKRDSLGRSEGLIITWFLFRIPINALAI